MTDKNGKALHDVGLCNHVAV